jgi:aryl-alcohol dehydrogenase (NADP+)
VRKELRQLEALVAVAAELHFSRAAASRALGLPARPDLDDEQVRAVRRQIAGGRSEEIIGRWFASRPADVAEPVVLATKGRMPVDGSPNGAGLSARHLTRALDTSLRRLGLKSVDLYQVHAYDPLTPLEETLRTLDQFVRAGKIRYWGLSNFTGWQLTKAVHLARALNVAGPVTLQPQYSLLAREIEWEIAPAALDAGTGLLPWSPLGGGWLSGKYKRDERPAGATASARIPTAVWKPMTGAARNAPGTSSTWCRRWPRIAACPWPRSRWRGCPAGPPSPRPSSGPAR